MNKLRELFPANRVAALSVFLTALAAQVTALAGVWPESEITTSIVAVAAFASQIAIVLKFLSGSQKWDELEALQKLPLVEEEVPTATPLWEPVERV